MQPMRAEIEDRAVRSLNSARPTAYLAAGFEHDAGETAISTCPRGGNPRRAGSYDSNIIHTVMYLEAAAYVNSPTDPA